MYPKRKFFLVYAVKESEPKYFSDNEGVTRIYTHVCMCLHFYLKKKRTIFFLMYTLFTIIPLDSKL